MNWCQPHWDQLKRILALKGLDVFGAKDATEATAMIQRSMEEGSGQEDSLADFDPLLGSWARINTYMAESLNKQGRQSEILNLACPLCLLVLDRQPRLVENWLEGVTDEAKLYAMKQGWLKAS